MKATSWMRFAVDPRAIGLLAAIVVTVVALLCCLAEAQAAAAEDLASARNYYLGDLTRLVDVEHPRRQF